MTEKGYEKHAWKSLFAMGVVLLVLALPALFGVDVDPIHSERIMGITLEELEASDPRFFEVYVFDTRNVGLLLLLFAILAMAISVTAYRRGEKWAWYALWSFPALFMGFIAIDITAGATLTVLALVGGRGVLQEGLPILEGMLILTLLGLLLPYRKFFPKFLTAARASPGLSASSRTEIRRQGPVRGPPVHRRSPASSRCHP